MRKAARSGDYTIEIAMPRPDFAGTGRRTANTAECIEQQPHARYSAPQRFWRRLCDAACKSAPRCPPWAPNSAPPRCRACRRGLHGQPVQIAHFEHRARCSIIAGGPYGCASAFADVMPGPSAVPGCQAMNGCMLDAMQAWGSQPELLAEQRASLPISAASMRRTGWPLRVYLFSGTNDRIVLPSIVAAAASFTLGVPDAQVKLVSDISASRLRHRGQGLACGLGGATSRTATTTRQVCCWLTSMVSRSARAWPASSSSRPARIPAWSGKPRPRRSGRRLLPRACRRPGLPRAHRLPRLQSAVPRPERFRRGPRPPVGGWQPPDRAVSAGDDRHALSPGCVGRDLTATTRKGEVVAVRRADRRSGALNRPGRRVACGGLADCHATRLSALTGRPSRQLREASQPGNQAARACAAEAQRRWDRGHGGIAVTSKSGNLHGRPARDAQHLRSLSGQAGPSSAAWHSSSPLLDRSEPPTRTLDSAPFLLNDHCQPLPSTRQL